MPRNRSIAELLAAEINSHRRSQGKRSLDPLLMQKYPVSKIALRGQKLGVDHPTLRDPNKVGNTFGPGPKLKGVPR